MAIETSKQENNLHPDAFKNTGGIVFKFNRDGLKILEEHEVSIGPFGLAAKFQQPKCKCLHAASEKP